SGLIDAADIKTCIGQMAGACPRAVCFHLIPIDAPALLVGIVDEDTVHAAGTTAIDVQVLKRHPAWTLQPYDRPRAGAGPCEDRPMLGSAVALDSDRDLGRDGDG